MAVAAAVKKVPAAQPLATVNLSDIDLRLLRVFAAVVEAGGFSAAQVELNIGQSTISTHMAELESRIGVQLCRRGRSGFALTQHGQAVYEACQMLFAALDDFRSAIGDIHNQVIGSLNIGMLDNTLADSKNQLPEAIANFKRMGPLVQVNLTIASPSEIARGILDNRLHIGLTTAHHREPGLDYEMVYQETQHLFCGKGHRLFEQAPNRLQLREIADYESAVRGYEEARHGIHSLVKTRPSTLAYNLEGVATMILSGHYVGILPTDYAKTWTDQDLMRPLRPDLLEDRTPLYLVTKRRQRVPTALRDFRKELAAVFPSLELPEQ